MATVWNTRVLTLRYRFSVVHRERFDADLSLGFFGMKVTSGLRRQVWKRT